MAKTFIITLAAAAGLDKSIVKWERVVNDNAPGISSCGCGLCEEYNNPLRGLLSPCAQCPVRLDTGERFCKGTPYAEYVDWVLKERPLEDSPLDKGLATAQAELDYLRDLKTRCTVDPEATMNGVA